jgi:hypothetical protein
MNKWLFAAALLLALPHAALQAQQIRKWNDNGRIVYSDVSPSPTAREVGAVAGAPNGAQAAPAAGPNQAGVIEFYAGKVSITHGDGRPAAAAIGAKVLEGDAIATAGDGELHIDMTDGGVLAVRPNSQVQIASYQANGEASDHSVVNLITGGLRSITGWIGKSLAPNYRITTASATIGVRGTDHETTVIPAGSAVGEPGTYEKVYAGESVLQGAQGSVSVKPTTNPGYLSLAGKEAPRILPAAPAFLKAAPHDGRLQGRHDAVLRSYEQKREQRRQQVRESLQHRPQESPGGKAAAKGPPAAPPSATAGEGVSEEDLRRAQETLREVQKKAEERRRAIDDAGSSK